jgi:hypothetical protein
MNQSRHILKLSCGLTAEMQFNETTGWFACEWSPELPTRSQVPSVEKEYLPWRNEIIESWARRNNKRVLVVDL